MEISIIPRWILKYLASDYERQNDVSILMSNLLLIMVFVFFKNPLLGIINFIPHFCLFDKIFGIECPVCGTTRSFCELSNGNWSNALKLNSSSFFVAFFFMFQVPLRIFSLSTKNMNQGVNLLSKYLGNMILAIILILWILKVLMIVVL